jgi:glucose-6-phosphate 1-dehydrogenase
MHRWPVYKESACMDSQSSNRPLTITVVGASGDLARKKVMPALFALYCQGLLPEDFHILGLARSDMSAERFRERIMEHLTCRYTPGENCAARMDEFLARCSYVSGEYGASDSFLALYALERELVGEGDIERLFYMAIPPFLFLPVARAIGDAGLVQCGVEGAWSRVVIEKPFGEDRPTSDELVHEMAQVFTEEQTFRIDHYLGKEVIQNLLVLRFANQIFSPMWSHECIESVEITWQEDIGVGDRGGYFDKYGILRDVMQNHLLQILALVAMEQPEDLSAHHVRNEKVRVLRKVPALSLDDVVLGQYGPAPEGKPAQLGYCEEPSVPDDSHTPTYGAAVLTIDVPRWQGVPFFISAGKGLAGRSTEIRITFKPVAENLFRSVSKALVPNELVVRVQPNESISFHILNKVPGLQMELAETALDLHYESKFRATIPDAYETLLLDVIKGDKSLFIRSDELAAAWDVFTPFLHEIDDGHVQPETYAFGTNGPTQVAAFRRRAGLAEKDEETNSSEA